MKKSTLVAAAAAAAIAATVFLPAATPARADDGKSSWWAPRLRSKEAAPEAQQQQAQNEVPNNTAPAPPPAGTHVAVAAVLPDPSLLKINKHLKEGPIGRDANARAYLDLIEVGGASTAQLNDFAAYLAKRGMPRVALAYQQYAVRLDGNDPTLLLNLGTLHQTLHETGSAESAFRKCLDIDPNFALAHYNLGTAYDTQKKYDEAIEEYRRALVLDPSLGDPRKNPQVVNNENLLAVKLQIYANQAGSLGLPLKQMQPDVSAKPAPKPAEKDDKH
jgi:tetratricopeptide (TPR) repeat protein